MAIRPLSLSGNQPILARHGSMEPKKLLFGSDTEGPGSDSLSLEVLKAQREEKIGRLTAHLENDGFEKDGLSVRLEEVFLAVFKETVPAVRAIANNKADMAVWRSGLEAQTSLSKTLTFLKQVQYRAMNPFPVLPPDIERKTWVPGENLLQPFTDPDDSENKRRGLAVRVLSFLVSQGVLTASQERPASDATLLEEWAKTSEFQVNGELGWEVARRLGWVKFAEAPESSIRMSNFKILHPSATMIASESKRSRNMAEPRSGSMSIGGIPWLARMIDKARLDAAGEIENYDLEYPCPMDRGLLGNLGIDAKTFQKIAVESQSDEEILEQLKQAGAKV